MFVFVVAVSCLFYSLNKKKSNTEAVNDPQGFNLKPHKHIFCVGWRTLCIYIRATWVIRPDMPVNKAWQYHTLAVIRRLSLSELSDTRASSLLWKQADYEIVRVKDELFKKTWWIEIVIGCVVPIMQPELYHASL